MIGHGQAHVRTVVAIAQSQHQDQSAPPCIEAFASLGNFGSASSSKNEERDLHRWLKNLYNLQLEVYWTHLKLQAPLLLNLHPVKFLEFSKRTRWFSQSLFVTVDMVHVYFIFKDI